MTAANWVQDMFRALPRYFFVLTAVSALALLARAAVPSLVPLPSISSSPASPSRAQAGVGVFAPAFALQTRQPGPVRPDPRTPPASYSAAMHAPFSAVPR